MSTRRCSRQHKPRWIERVITSVISEPAKRAATVFDGRRRRRLARRSILDVDGRPTQFEVRQQVEHIALFLSVNPTAAVIQNQRRGRTRSILRQIKIEFQLEVTCLRISNIRKDIDLRWRVINPAIRTSLAVGRSADYAD